MDKRRLAFNEIRQINLLLSTERTIWPGGLSLMNDNCISIGVLELKKGFQRCRSALVVVSTLSLLLTLCTILQPSHACTFATLEARFRRLFQSFAFLLMGCHGRFDAGVGWHWIRPPGCQQLFKDEMKPLCI